MKISIETEARVLANIEQLMYGFIVGCPLEFASTPLREVAGEVGKVLNKQIKKAWNLKTRFNVEKSPRERQKLAKQNEKAKYVTLKLNWNLATFLQSCLIAKRDRMHESEFVDYGYQNVLDQISELKKQRINDDSVFSL